MTNRNLLLGRARPKEKLSKEEIAALEATMPEPRPQPASRPTKPAGKKGGGPQRMVRRDLLKFRWSLECSGCGFKVNGDGQPQPGQRLRGAAAASWSWSWVEGDASDNPEYVNHEAPMTEAEMLKEIRIIVTKVTHVDQASRCAPSRHCNTKPKPR